MAGQKLPEPAPQSRNVDASGAVALAAQLIQFSKFASDAARRAFVERISDGPATDDPAALRAHYGRFNDALAKEMRAKYAVDVSHEIMGGVAVQRVMPCGADSRRGLLINLHGGAFMWGAGSGALVEAIPIAATARMPVVTVDYRMAPEHRFPAASQDAAAVYQYALRDYAAEEIGIYGLSAGAVLSAQTMAWLRRHQVPLPGALAMLGGAGMDFGGDSSSVGDAVMGAPASGDAPSIFNLLYMREANPDDPLAVPERDDELLAAFPPSLLISGSRDFAASSVTRFHRRLVANGVDARLFLFDGLWHAFHIFCDLPESEETYQIMADFFTRTLRPVE